MNTYLIFALGVITGLALSRILLSINISLRCELGDFVVETTDEGKLICRLEIEKLQGIEQKSYVILKVKNISRK